MGVDGSVVTWGAAQCGGDSTKVRQQLTDVSCIYSTRSAFAAVKVDGTIVTWGDAECGGDSTKVRPQLTGISSIFSTQAAFAAFAAVRVVGSFQQLTGISSVASTDTAFAALKVDGTVVTWG